VSAKVVTVTIGSLGPNLLYVARQIYNNVMTYRRFPTDLRYKTIYKKIV